MTPPRWTVWFTLVIALGIRGRDHVWDAENVKAMHLAAGFGLVEWFLLDGMDAQLRMESWMKGGICRSSGLLASGHPCVCRAPRERDRGE